MEQCVTLSKSVRVVCAVSFGQVFSKSSFQIKLQAQNSLIFRGEALGLL